MAVYKTQQGDTWDLIAYRLYPKVGREMCMERLLEANEAHRETVIFGAGVTLSVPEIEIPAANNLPPWKRKAASR
jgi:phage tail protein X